RGRAAGAVPAWADLPTSAGGPPCGTPSGASGSPSRDAPVRRSPCPCLHAYGPHPSSPLRFNTLLDQKRRAEVRARKTQRHSAKVHHFLVWTRTAHLKYSIPIAGTRAAAHFAARTPTQVLHVELEGTQQPGDRTGGLPDVP